ncbi:MAG: hypothetical protein AMJ42_00340 [Deltaproteobacteria bacterium DG_8]|nr:MAG: hypothetical protein AMJ42_00340 [Deltaproteobacteria bacterium DG_8]
MRNFLNTVFFALIILFFVTFSLSNSQSIQLNYFGILLRPVPISLLVLIPFLVGIVLGSFLDLAERFSLKREVKRLEKELKEFKEKTNST